MQKTDLCYNCTSVTIRLPISASRPAAPHGKEELGMSEQQPVVPQDEKEAEKEREKEQEKEREKAGEKSWDEKWRRDPLSAAVWACILIWAGLAFLADNLKLLASLNNPEPWQLILVGAGVILLLEVAVRLLVPAYRRSIAGTLILGLVLLGTGLGNILGTPITMPVILIAIGVALLLRGILRGK
jgi:hypothetical protein